ncbi:hypothetical protein [Vibrio phage vB_VpaP_SJSY21]|nr:hypothetical protein [Vibrio phage vB_VpaP_SJSY21]
MFSLDINGESYFDSYERDFEGPSFNRKAAWKMYYDRLESFNCTTSGYRGGAVVIRHISSGKSVMVPRTLVRNDGSFLYIHRKVGLKLLYDNFKKIGVSLEGRSYVWKC